MSTPCLRRTITGAGLALSLALLATPAAAQAGHAAARSARRTQAERTTASTTSPGGLLSALWSFVTGTDPHGPHTSQGPTADPNGVGKS